MDPDNFHFAPLFPEPTPGPISICVVIRKKQDPAGGWLVPVNRLYDATVYLGCMRDARGNLKDWLEIWVQSVSKGEQDNPSKNTQLNNGLLDQRWVQRATLLQQLDPKSVIAGPWQEEHPLPLYFARDTWEPLNPSQSQDGANHSWELCTDDAVLQGAGLPAFSTSVFRYLHLRSRGKDSMFIALDEAAPRSKRVMETSVAASFLENVIPFNPDAGLLFIRKHYPLSLRDFKRILEGYGWAGAGLGVEKLRPSSAYTPFLDNAYSQNNHGLIFCGRRGQAGRVLECLLLKLLLWRELVAKTAAIIKHESCPLLTLAADDFRVRLLESGGRLPSCWGFEVSAARTSESVALSVEGKGSRFFKPLAGLSSSIYQPTQMSPYREGRGNVRLRDVRRLDASTVVCEGTLAAVGSYSIGPSDLIWLELPASGRWVSFHARPLARQNLAETELRFETLPRVLDGPVADALTMSKGQQHELPYKVHTIASSPCDLYSLAIIGLEILIDSNKAALAVVKDECLSLARQVAAEDEKLSLSARRAKVVAADARFRKALGQHNLSGENLDPQLAQAIVPDELWWSVFDVLIRMLPGADPTSWARDLGDVNAFALESCFTEPLREMDDLIERTRSLLFVDWTFNGEVRKILDELAD
jgi:hypothetical protein